MQSWLVVDGQQRLTTRSILLCAIRDHVRDTDTQPAAKIDDLYLFNKYASGTARYTLLPTKADPAAWIGLIERAPEAGNSATRSPPPKRSCAPCPDPRKRFPTDQHVRDAVLANSFYWLGRDPQRTFIPRCIEEDYRHGEPIDFDRAKVTIEHVLPQSPTDEWWDMLRPDLADGETLATQDREPGLCGSNTGAGLRRPAAHG